MGWTGKILRVDLTAGTTRAEPTNMDWARDYLGQRGLASKYLYEEMDPAVDALDPANKLIFASGPLTATMAPTGGRYSVITKGPLTGTIACSNSGGKVGAEFKRAGWDMIIFEGRAPKPIYLYVEDDRAEILPADDLWGRSVWEVDETIHARHQDPQIRIAAIGRAGEVGVRFACIVNDLDRAAGRSGVGAVMGSKNLKALAVRATRGVTVRDPQAFMAAVRAARAKLDPSPARKRLADLGTHAMLDVTHAYGSLPTRNGRDVQFEGTPKINAAAVKKPRASDGKPNLVHNKACFACTIGCGRVATIDPTHFSIKDKPQYHHASGGLEYENIYAFGPMCGVDDLDACTYVNFLCNEHAMDTISFGVSVAAAMELFEVGAISEKETGGIALRFGSAEALVAMAEATALGEGFGADIGLGAARLCAKYGRPELAMVAKGQEFPGYDPRAMQGMGLAYATSNRGACHLKASPYTSDFQTLEIEGKAQIIKDTQDDRGATYDSSGICLFTSNALSIEDVSAMIQAACDGDWSPQRLIEVGERIWNLERLFNLRAGFTAADDTLPRRMLEEPAKSGTAKGRVCRLGEMLPEYYRLRGWDAEGRPKPETLARLGLA